MVVHTTLGPQAGQGAGREGQQGGGSIRCQKEEQIPFGNKGKCMKTKGGENWKKKSTP